MTGNKTEDSKYLALNILLDIPTLETGSYESFCAKLEENLQQCVNKFGEHDELIFTDNDLFSIYFARVTGYLKNINSDCELSFQQRQIIRKSLQLLVNIGFLPNLIPKIAEKLILNNKQQYTDYVLSNTGNDSHTISVQRKYKKLCISVNSFVMLSANCAINRVITAHFMNVLLGALFQLCFAPLKLPNAEMTSPLNNAAEFIMTEEFYCSILKDRIVFKEILNKLLSKTDQILIFKEIMTLQETRTSSTPGFLRRELTYELERRLTATNGLTHFMRALIDSSNFDVGQNWRQVEIISKLIALKPRILNENDYFANIIKQIFNMLEIGISNNDSVMLTVSSACIRSFYDSWTKDKFSQEILFLFFEPFITLSQQKTEPISDSQSKIFEKANLYIKCIHSCFLRFNETILPIQLLSPVIYILYKWCQACEGILKDEFTLLFKIVVKFFSNSPNGAELFGLFIYEDFMPDFFLIDNEIMKSFFNKFKGSYNVHPDKTFIIRIFKSVKTKNLLYNLFLYLLKDFCEHTTIHRNEKYLHRNIICIQLLSELTDDEDIRIKVLADPSKIVEFVSTMIHIKVNCNSVHDYSKISSDNLLMCLTMLSTVFHQVRDLNRDTSCFDSLYVQLVELRKMNNIEKDIKHWAENILGYLQNPKLEAEYFENLSNPNNSLGSVSRCQEALNKICDPLLPVRAHGLIEIAKLAKEKDEELIIKKHYIICMLQDQLKHEDTYIFLPAINALTSMATIYPELVIETLTQGYLKESKKLTDGIEYTSEYRMKIGEALMKIIKNSDASLSQYKTVFLNTFLMGSRDDDYLIKVSSLSNLGELCRVLAYDLGKEIVLQILNMVENIINTEKIPEVRRAAVLICTQLIRGIRDGKPGIIAGLKLLYPSQVFLINALNTAYKNDSDETVRLHAQVAVEELCEIFKEVMMIQNNTV